MNNPPPPPHLTFQERPWSFGVDLISRLVKFPISARIVLSLSRKRALRQKALATPDPSFERNIKVLNLYVLLRKVCMHPYLLEYPIDPETQDYRMDEELITSSGKTLLLDQMLPELKRRGHKVCWRYYSP